MSARFLLGDMVEGSALVLDEPLSLWGGLDPTTGAIVDRLHPQVGAVVTDRVLVLPAGRGSSSSSSVLAESIRIGTAPRALVLTETDQVLLVGALVAAELYDRLCAVVVVDPDHGIRDGDSVELTSGDDR